MWPLRKSETTRAAASAYARARVAHSSGGDGEAQLQHALELATKNERFVQSRQALYAWQDAIAGKIAVGECTVESAVAQMHKLVEDYNELIDKSRGITRMRTIYTAATAVLGGALALLAPGTLEVALGLGLAAVLVIQFWHLDRTPDVLAGDAAPAAMFHIARA